jgi:hypothetical protein
MNRKTKARLEVLNAIRDAFIRGGDKGRDCGAAMYDLMVKREINNAKAASLIGVSQHTVDAWLKPETSKSHHHCPSWALEILKIKTE